jgi:hypothetical protein
MPSVVRWGEHSVRRILTIVALGLCSLLALSALGLYGLSQGYFDSSVAHEPPPPPPVLDPSASLPGTEQFEHLARTDPVGFLKDCLLRYHREVQGYRATLVKHEVIGGKPGRVETIDVAFREDPFSVLLTWKTNPAGMADKVLYVAGQNGGKALARGKFAHMIHHRDPYSADAMGTSRVALPEFGMAKGTERTLAAWEAAKAAGRLHVEYLGIETVGEVGNVPCYVLRRTCDPPEEDGLVTTIMSFDTAHWLQVGNVLKAANDQPIASYFFKDIVLNPDFSPNQFDPSAVK